MLDVVNLRADIAGRLRRLLGQRFHFRGDDGKALAGGAGARRLDRGVEREQRGLRGDRLDQLDHGANALGRGGEAAHGEIGVAEIGNGAVGRVPGGRRLGRALHDQRQQSARGFRDRRHVAARGSGRLDGMRGAMRHVLVARAEIGGGDADFLAGGLKSDGELVNGGTEAPGEETAAGITQPRLGFAALVIDRQRVGVDQRLAHCLRSGGAVGERTAADPGRQCGIAVATGDLGDRIDDGAQHALARPRRGNRASQAGGKPQKQAARSPGRQHRNDADEHERQYDPGRQRAFVKIGGHFRLTWAGAGKSPGEHEGNCAYSITKSFPNAAPHRMNYRHFRLNYVRHRRAVADDEDATGI